MKFYIFKVFVCVCKCQFKQKRLENDATHSWCLKWQTADANEVCAVDVLLFYSYGYNLICILFVCLNQKVNGDKPLNH